jgi:hypothetical protein
MVCSNYFEAKDVHHPPDCVHKICIPCFKKLGFDTLEISHCLTCGIPFNIMQVITDEELDKKLMDLEMEEEITSSLEKASIGPIVERIDPQERVVEIENSRLFDNISHLHPNKRLVNQISTDGCSRFGGSGGKIDIMENYKPKTITECCSFCRKSFSVSVNVYVNGELKSGKEEVMEEPLKYLCCGKHKVCNNSTCSETALAIGICPICDV